MRSLYIPSYHHAPGTSVFHVQSTMILLPNTCVISECNGWCVDALNFNCMHSAWSRISLLNAYFDHHRAPHTQSAFTLHSASLLPDPRVLYLCVPECPTAPCSNCTLVMHVSTKCLLSPPPCSTHVQVCAETCHTRTLKQAECNGWCVDALNFNCMHSAWSCVSLLNAYFDHHRTPGTSVFIMWCSGTRVSVCLFWEYKREFRLA